MFIILNLYSPDLRQLILEFSDKILEIVVVAVTSSVWVHSDQQAVLVLFVVYCVQIAALVLWVEY